ncbi:MSHA biogenesis protein MshK [Alteromonas sp. 38]|uniref:hypothetical protein n=1 Tax=Alteromonas TaxID=226 RepID=UPI0012F19125|nr:MULTISPECIES: hypothetical protein [Alteromonas]CAD5254877.1 MSHA biogenesis protein MshK [Alteromonas sp. 154]VXB01657.1 MSHA biogenesis protein MshK [Alteromonas sp. 38]
MFKLILTLVLTLSSFVLFAQQDPTRPGNTKMKGIGAIQQGEFSLSAIMYSAQSKHAIINNKVVREGDNIAEGKVESITKNTVVILKTHHAKPVRTVLSLAPITIIKKNVSEDL